MMVVMALVAGYLLLSILAALILITACVAGKRCDSLFSHSSDLEQQNSFVSVRDEVNAESNAPAKVAHGYLNQFMPHSFVK
jgi:hypothetical protein